MKYKLFLIIVLYAVFSFSQCFDCGQNIGGWADDHARDLVKASDGIILSSVLNNYDEGLIEKYDFNCNLIWSIELLTDNSNFGLRVYKTAIDENDNIYAIIDNPYNTLGIQTFNGNQIPYGMNVIKIDSNGIVQWISFLNYGGQVGMHYWNGNLFIVGGYITKMDTDGNLLNELQIGSLGSSIYASEIDNNGNIYYTSSPSNSNLNYLTKINSNLEIQWENRFNNDNNSRFSPTKVYYNETNNKLYIWGRHALATTILGVNFPASNCGSNQTSSFVIELSTNDGSLENHFIFDNCGPSGSSGNGITNVFEKGFMTHKDNKLYVLSCFRGDVMLGNNNLFSVNSNGVINRNLVLYYIDLNDFSSTLLLTSAGDNYWPGVAFNDFPASIAIEDNDIYLSSTFMSHPMEINGVNIANNSGNNARDVMLFKYKLDQNDISSVLSSENTCINDASIFSLAGVFDSVAWDFDDPASGLNNISNLNAPSHTFSSIGNYNVTVLVTCGTESETISLEVVISDSPTVNQIGDLYSCEDTFGSQISSSFDTASIASDLIGNQTGLSIQYFDGNGYELPSPLSNPMSNSILGQETIIARIANTDNITCYTEVSFDLIVEDLPEIFQIADIHECDAGNGFAEFDLSNVSGPLTANSSSLNVSFYDSDNNVIPGNSLQTYSNMYPNEDFVVARVANGINPCFSETTIRLVVDPLPIANTVNTLYACDDNADGISEYFNTSNIENQVLNGQTGMHVTYYLESGTPLPSPLPNPFTNNIPNNQNIIVRVTNINTTCYKETTLELQTITQPNINQPDNLYACNQGDGYTEFDTALLEEQIIGSQTGLTIHYYDASNIELSSPLPTLFQNTEPYQQTIYVKIEDASNTLCFSETSFDLIVNKLPEADLEESYFICNLEPSMVLSVDSNYSSYQWQFEDGTIVSSSSTAEIINEGNYVLTVTNLENNIICENVFSFNLIRSVLPEIQNVNHGELGNNYMEIIASGDGDFEYSINGVHYQNSNYFSNVEGGTYTVFVKDKDGCGQDSTEITIIDYPKLFTPNNDRYNDYWQIEGVTKFPNATILIFDRYGKIIKQLSTSSLGWDGTFNGNPLNTNDYWFTVDLGNGKSFSGHFTLKR
ncbi:T9SS type B sorting domain-containing protein [Lacinutrix sp. WUR7]|uniref:T9SS type B sorting domain-containing protein n=1 Tax=Lacinutrix sp. WUR7 TaxID=2653681 RepID=UPI00193D93A8|nr:T9SS type B sorting domain-containing protein [Lacinutrix sp. WUR7]QRM89296.1 T9SS type B sorting domain-containing protein [Lacinutrix sp. WUR7]